MAIIRKGLKPGFRFGLEPPDAGYRRVLPFPRNWKVLALLLALDVAFLFPAWGAYHQAAAEWSRFNDLFDLVAAVFLSAWLLGWSIAPLLITAVLLALLLGREVIRAKPQQLELFVGLPGIGVTAVYGISAMRNFRLQQAEKKSGHAWRGSYLCFDYGANRVEFGSHLDAADASEIRHGIETVAGRTIRTGAAPEAETEQEWEAHASPVATVPATAAASTSNPAGPAGPRSWASPSTLLLIAANLVPVVGTAFFGWRLADVMVLYWCESAIIGFFNLAKIIVVNRWLALFSGVFFVAHFGAFMAVHFLFIYTLFVQGVDSASSSGGDLGEVAAMLLSLWPALLALFISHGYSFFVNFLGHREFAGRPVREQMAEPYKRIIFMHLVLIFGGGLSLFLGDVRPVLLLVIGIKIWLDARAHIREHAPNVD